MIDVLFLDFDGVLISYDYVNSLKAESDLGFDWYSKPNPYTDWDSRRNFDPKNVASFNQILEAHPNLKLVICSAWRIHSTVGKLGMLMRANGVNITNRQIIGTTPVTGNGRFSEIQQWIRDYLQSDRESIRSHTILDDDGADELREVYGCDNFFRPAPSIGLQDDMAQNIINYYSEYGKVQCSSGTTAG
jgi:hypothetical protein